MPKGVSRALGAVAALLMVAPGAGAYSMGLTWIDTGGAGITGSDTISAKPGDEVTLQIDFHPEGTEIAGLFFSADYDLNGMNELDLVSCTTTPVQIDPVSGSVYMDIPFCGDNQGSAFPNVESAPGLAGEVNGMAILTSSPPYQSTGTIVVGEMTFRVNQPLTDGADISVGVLRPGLDGLIISTGENLLLPRVVLATASVIVNPEPGTAGLVVLGLIGLGAARRRRHSQPGS